MKPFIACLVAYCLTVTPASSWASSSQSPLIPVHEAPPIAKTIVEWLDTTHVLVNGHDAADPDAGVQVRNGAVRSQTDGAYVWDLATGTLVRDARFDDAKGVCVHGDHLSYLVPTGDGKPWKRMTFIHGEAVKEPSENERWFNPMSCAFPSSKPAWVTASENGRRVVPLLEEHGYIDRGTTKEWSEPAPLIYYRLTAQKPMALGLDNRQVQSQARYMPFLDGYVLVGDRSNANVAPVWLLHPNGRVEQIFSPEGKAWGALSWPWMVVTKQGLLFASLSFRGPHSAEKGLYLWTNGALLRVADGYFPNQAMVSPDGCRVAVGKQQQGQYVSSSERWRMQVIDLCPEEAGSPVYLPTMKQQCVLEGPPKMSAYGWTRNWIGAPLFAEETSFFGRIWLVMVSPFFAVPETVVAPIYFTKDFFFWLSCGT